MLSLYITLIQNTMPTQRERQEYLWRPNDNSSTTLTRYSLEAEHWTRAFQDAEIKNRKSSLCESMSVIGLVLSLVGNLILLIVLSLTSFVKWLRS